MVLFWPSETFAITTTFPVGFLAFETSRNSSVTRDLSIWVTKLGFEQLPHISPTRLTFTRPATL
jgi:hypothetical protein